MRARMRVISEASEAVIAETTWSSFSQPVAISGTPDDSAMVFAVPLGVTPRAAARSATWSAALRAATTSSSSCRWTLRKFLPMTFQCACFPIRDRSTRSTSVACSTAPTASRSASASGLVIGFLAIVDRASSDGDGERHLDVAARRVRVRADLVGLLDELLRDRLFETGDVHGELDGQLEAAGPVRADPHLGGYLRRRKLNLARARDGGEGGVEARRVAGREELLGVGRVTAGATHLLRDRQHLVDHAVGGAHLAVAAFAVCSRLGRVQRVHSALP